MDRFLHSERKFAGKVAGDDLSYNESGLSAEQGKEQAVILTTA